MSSICTPEDVLSALLLLRHVVPGEHPEISTQTAEMWHVTLALYPTDVVQHCAIHWAGQRFPSREEFREAVSAEQRARREAAANRALANPDEHPRCPACEGYGWAIITSDPYWVVEECPHGCEVPLPRHRQETRSRRTRGPSNTGPKKVQREVIETTGRIVGDRDGF